jgi:hypothetical protein
MKARELRQTIAQLQSQIDANNVRLRRTRAMVEVMTEQLRHNPVAEKSSPEKEK